MVKIVKKPTSDGQSKRGNARGKLGKPAKKHIARKEFVERVKRSASYGMKGLGLLKDVLEVDDDDKAQAPRHPRRQKSLSAARLGSLMSAEIEQFENVKKDTLFQTSPLDAIRGHLKMKMQLNPESKKSKPGPRKTGKPVTKNLAKPKGVPKDLDSISLGVE